MSESISAIVYVAITVLAFVFLVLIAVCIMTRKKRKRYSHVKEEGDSVVELSKNVEEKTNLVKMLRKKTMNLQLIIATAKKTLSFIPTN
jgi:heme/copper-type cytochrome/quinol oxidase subunit 2